MDEFYDRRVIRVSEVVKCTVLKDPKLTAGEMQRRKAENDRVRRLEEDQWAETAFLRSKVRYYERQVPSPSTAVFPEGNSGDK